MKKLPSPVPKTASVSDLQRNYAEIIADAKRSDEPVYLMKQNKPEALLMSVESYTILYNKVQEYELADTLHAIRVAEEELKSGSLQKLSNIDDLLTD